MTAECARIIHGILSKHALVNCFSQSFGSGISHLLLDVDSFFLGRGMIEVWECMKDFYSKSAF